MLFRRGWFLCHMPFCRFLCRMLLGREVVVYKLGVLKGLKRKDDILIMVYDEGSIIHDVRMSSASTFASASPNGRTSPTEIPSE
ncbi:hypothetical protein QJS10_CPA02g00700 [Acorus calamus]|uniref:Secreted protein n=1 Tax=Acorus calamus TaxID=4465 RepID=A0AAV9FFR6_ACOCL|nr:hypothetical protein QJS10_CPA02g00700 [Acorus calamus]